MTKTKREIEESLADNLGKIVNLRCGSLASGEMGELITGKLNEYKAGYFSVTNQESGDQHVFSLAEVGNIVEIDTNIYIFIWMVI